MRIHTTVWGVGNPLLRDDAVGLEVVRLLGKRKLPNFSLRLCELAPANYLATLKKECPRRFLLIDASDMGLPPGSLRRFPLARVDDPSFTSHDLPLPQLLAGVLPPDCEAWVIAIQPQSAALGIGLTSVAAKAAQACAKLIAAGQSDQIDTLKESGESSV